MADQTGYGDPQVGPMAPGGEAGQQQGAPTAPMAERPFPLIKLRGLPFDVNEDEIRAFLELEPLDILLVKRDGRFSGEAFILLPDAGHIQAGLDKNKSYMGRRYVEVFRAKKLDYYKAVLGEMLDGTGMARPARGGMGPQQGQGGMMMHPGYAPAMQHGYGMQGYGGYGGGYANGGGGYGGGGGGGYGGAYGGGGGGGGGHHAPREESNVLRLRGLPFTAGKDDIIRWFEDVAVTPPAQEGVHIITDGGRPTGVALVEFASPPEAQAGMAKDKQMMGSRYIEVFMSSRDELQRYLPRSY
ncbi:MAG: hypothetical protein J3K34DRAFT_524870 [Monoraphidium minutum]|nr:MAG: hypothetical protein J3K34DRAFT_524870 [Monoraphidium minutum]